MTKTELQLLLDLGDALDHWLHQHAPEMCDRKQVTATWMFMMKNGGTLAYIADLRQRIRVQLRRMR